MAHVRLICGAVVCTGVFGAAAQAANMAVSIAVRETGNDVAVGADGGTANGIEWIHLDGFSVPIDGAYHTLTFDFSAHAVTPFAGSTADGTLAAANNKGVLEHIRVLNVDGSTDPVIMFIDNIRNQTSIGPQFVQDFEGFADGTEVTFQEPGFSGSTAGNMLAGSTGGVDSTMPTEGLAGYRFDWQFIDSDPTRWVRLTTFALGQADPNPTIDFSPGNTLSFDVRFVPIPEPTTVAMLGLGALGLLARRRA